MTEQGRNDDEEECVKKVTEHMMQLRMREGERERQQRLRIKAGVGGAG